MKKFLLAAFVCASIAGLTGCTTSYRDGGADCLYRPEPTNAPNYYTEYNVSEQRISNKGEASVLFWVFQFSEGKYCTINSDPNVGLLASIFNFFSPSRVAVDNAKKAALFNALSNSSADQLLGAIYEYTVTDYVVFSKVECSVKGFPATVKGVKFYDKKPVILNSWQKVEYLNPQDYPVDYTSKVDDRAIPFLIGK